MMKMLSFMTTVLFFCYKTDLTFLGLFRRRENLILMQIFTRQELCSSDRYNIHLYCCAVEAGFYNDAVECLTVMQADRVQDPAGDISFYL